MIEESERLKSSAESRAAHLTGWQYRFGRIILALSASILFRLILLGAGGLIQPTVSAFVQNASTLTISLNVTVHWPH